MYVPETATTLTMRLVNGVLFDRQGRIGSIVANRQFQFDGPPAQAGSIYTAGWSLCPDENVLALGDQKLFWQCASGNFNNLYDQKIAEQCSPIFLKIVHFQ
ncbi:hypothetical protein EX30DRAFT_306197 [Ascodesmis nigricans]|uniref:Cell wall mannoprotein PIR1-like C-terminal domain-containing protein n=1 Tax=Ascodesmis nigricans TaxID=341454 RepID=A0A4S2MY57_9PEZI|nr:hypothetical protein EX30DRAFT_306197 [Ascodesmis nigricans]